MLRDRDGRPKADPLAVALLVDLLGISRSMERDLLSVLLIYRCIFLRVFIVYRILLCGPPP